MRADLAALEDLPDSGRARAGYLSLHETTGHAVGRARNIWRHRNARIATTAHAQTQHHDDPLEASDPASWSRYTARTRDQRDDRSRALAATMLRARTLCAFPNAPGVIAR